MRVTCSFCIQPLDPKTIERLHSLQLTAQSHDQGSSNISLAGNWTWFELALMENEYSESPRIKDGIELNWISHLNHLRTEKYRWVRTQRLTNGPHRWLVSWIRIRLISLTEGRENLPLRPRYLPPA